MDDVVAFHVARPFSANAERRWRNKPHTPGSFWALVSTECTANGCRVWLGWRYPRSGYGRIFYQGRARTAHAVAYELANNIEIPFSEKRTHSPAVMHRCDNPPCCEPSHLRLGTTLDNNRDIVAKGRQMRGVQHHLTKLTEEDVRDIRLTSDAGVRASQLARRYAVNHATIQRICRRLTWKHVP